MLDLLSLKLAENEIRDVRPLIQLGQWGTIDVRRQKVILDDAEINKEVKIPVYDLEGERIEKITLKSAGGMLTDEGIIWSTLGEKYMNLTWMQIIMRRAYYIVASSCRI